MTEKVQPMVASGLPLNETAKIRKIAFVGDHLPRKCGIATFTTDLLSAVQNAYPQSQCLCVSVNDIEDGYDYPEVVRFEIEEQDLPLTCGRRISSTSAMWMWFACSMSSAYLAARSAVTSWPCCGS